MKRLQAAALLCALLLLLSACGSTISPAAGTAAAPTGAAGTEETRTEADPAIPLIRRTLKKSDFEALPVANAGMTNEELRRICVEYYRMMGEIRWTLSDDGTLTVNGTGRMDDYGFLHDTESNGIRDKIKKGESVENLHSPSVYSYIKTNKLYI